MHLLRGDFLLSTNTQIILFATMAFFGVPLSESTSLQDFYVGGNPLAGLCTNCSRAVVEGFGGLHTYMACIRLSAQAIGCEVR